MILSDLPILIGDLLPHEFQELMSTILSLSTQTFVFNIHKFTKDIVSNDSLLHYMYDHSKECTLIVCKQ